MSNQPGDKAILREALAAYAHEAWSQWVAYMFEHGGQVTNSFAGASYWTMKPEKYDRWQRQMNTAYADLPESEKNSDRDEADKMLAIVNEATPRQAADFLRQNHDKDWIVSLLVCLLDPAAEGRHTR